jgi:Uma2 family endonuclease
MNVVQAIRPKDESALRDEPMLLRITAAQFSLMVEAGAFSGGPGVELRGGLLYRINPQYVPHLMAKTELYDALLEALRALGSSLRVSSEGSVHLGDADVPLPDLIVWEPLRRRGPVPGDRVRIVAEISDTTLADDLGHKRALYATASIPEYWVVDLAGRAVHQYWAPMEGAYARSAVVPFGDTLRSVTVDGLTVPTGVLDGGEGVT